MSEKERKKKHVEQEHNESFKQQEHNESLKQQEQKAEYEMGYKKGQRLRGFLEILVGVLILFLGLWLWSRTWGTRLLFTNAAIGSVARYYWIVLIIAVVMLIVGLLTMRKVRIEKKPEGVKKEADDKTIVRQEADDKTIVRQEADDNTLVKHKAANDEEETLILSDAAVTENGEKKNEPDNRLEKVDAPDRMIPAVPEKKKAEVPSAETLKMTDNQCPGCGKDKKTGKVFCIYCGYKF